MKRKKIVTSLIKEGFTEKTLASLSDKELRVLSNRILGEQMVTTVPTPNSGNVTPVTNVSRTDTATQNALKQQKKPFSTYESEEKTGNEKKEKLIYRIKNKIENTKDEKKKGYLNDLLNKLKDGNKVKEKELVGVSLNEWVNQIIEKNVHTFTSKNEILDLIQDKLQEQEVMTSEKKSTLPAFLTYDELKNMEAGGDVETAPAKPKVVPGTRPTTDPGKAPGKDNPYKPGPGKNPKPKAQKHE